MVKTTKPPLVSPREEGFNSKRNYGLRTQMKLTGSAAFQRVLVRELVHAHEPENSSPCGACRACDPASSPHDALASFVVDPVED